MTVMVCRVAWMKHYQADGESAVGGGSFVVDGNMPHESLNFQPVGREYYGFVQNWGQKININKLGGTAGDEAVTGVRVVFCAEDPETSEFLVVGWYDNATVYRQSFERLGDDLDPPRRIHIKASTAILVPELERCFQMPRARDRPPSKIGGVGQHAIWYGLNLARAQTFRELLNEYIAAPELNREPREVVLESRKRRKSERLERYGAYRKFIVRKGYRCEVCGWSINDKEEEVWSSSFELHHLAPISNLAENETREVRLEDFAVLCASCHRAIHRTEFVADVAGFARNHARG